MKANNIMKQKKSLLLFCLLLLSSLRPTLTMCAAIVTPSNPQNLFYSFKEALYLLATQIENVYRNDIFSKDEYEQYMRLIQELDPAVYTKLRNYESG